MEISDSATLAEILISNDAIERESVSLPEMVALSESWCPNMRVTFTSAFIVTMAREVTQAGAPDGGSLNPRPSRSRSHSLKVSKEGGGL